MCLLYI